MSGFHQGRQNAFFTFENHSGQKYTYILTMIQPLQNTANIQYKTPRVNKHIQTIAQYLTLIQTSQVSKMLRQTVNKKNNPPSTHDAFYILLYNCILVALAWAALMTCL